MAENFFQATKIRLRILLGMIRPFRNAYVVLAAFFLLAPLIESLNVTMLIPLFGLMLDRSAAATFRLPAALEQFLRPFLAMRAGVVCVFFVAVFLARGILMYFMSVQNERLSHLVREFWMMRIFSNYVHGDYAAVAREPGGVLSSNILQETEAGRNTIFQLMTLISGAVSILVYFVFLLLISWKITLLVSVLAGATLFLVSRGISNTLAQMGKTRSTQIAQAGQTLNEAMRGLREIKALSLEDWACDRLGGHLRRMIRSQSQYAVLRHIPHHFQDFFIISGFLIGIYLIARAQGDLKQTFPIILAFTLMCVRLVREIDVLFTMHMSVLYSLPALRIVQKEMESERVRRRQPGKEKIFRIETDIRIENLSFGYERDQPVLRGINLTIPRRGMTALAGPSGCGKSTLADLLLRLHDPQEGRIAVNGIDLRGIDPASWRRRIGFVAQDGFLFSGTIRDNIAMGKPGVSDEEIVEAARIANAWEFICELPGRLNTVIGERGYGLSGGQRQRLQIARAVVRKPDLLIFDEATSALDTRSERMIQRAVETISADVATVVIAHRLSTIEHADQIVLLDAGRVQAVGTYEELLERSALCRSLQADGAGEPQPQKP